MPSSHTLDGVAVTFDDDRLVADAGLIVPATLAQHLGLRELFDTHVDLGDAPGRAHVGHKAMTLIHCRLADGDSIDDADALRAGATQVVLGHAVLAPSTLGTFLRASPGVTPASSTRSPASCWRGRGRRAPGRAAAVTIDVDSTIVRPTGWPNKAAPSSPTTTCAATTRCSR